MTIKAEVVEVLVVTTTNQNTNTTLKEYFEKDGTELFTRDNSGYVSNYEFQNLKEKYETNIEKLENQIKISLAKEIISNSQHIHDVVVSENYDEILNELVRKIKL